MKKPRINSKRYAKTALLFIGIMAFSLANTADARTTSEESLVKAQNVKNEITTDYDSLLKTRQEKLEKISTIQAEKEKVDSKDTSKQKVLQSKKEVAKKQLKDAATNKLQQAMSRIQDATELLATQLTLNKQKIDSKILKGSPMTKELQQYTKAVKALAITDDTLIQTEVLMTRALSSAKDADSKNAAQSLRDAVAQYNKTHDVVDTLSELLAD